MMIYQVNTIDDDCISTPLMVTTEIGKAIEKANLVLSHETDAEVLTWTTETKFDVAVAYSVEYTISRVRFVDNGNGIVEAKTVIENSYNKNPLDDEWDDDVDDYTFDIPANAF